MVIGIFGESCTGKSTIANEISLKTNAKIYTGKDYIKLAKNEVDAKKQFVELLKSNETTNEVLIYVISEKEHLSFLPEKAFRVLVTAGLDMIKERFSKRTNGNLPAPVAAMLERKHGLFDDERHDLHIENNEVETLPSEHFQELLDFIGYLKIKPLKAVPETALISESSLAKDWNTEDEDKAWANL